MTAVGFRPKAGMRVKAFHPWMMGVVKVGTVHKVGSKYARIDFGTLNGGVLRVRFRDVLEETS